MISIITAIHNQLDMNKVFFEKLNKYTHFKFELIIIDNASTDGSANFFESVGATVIRNKVNYSYPFSQNQGIKKASYPYLAFLNNDVIVARNWDRNLISVLNHHQLDAVTCCGIERVETREATRKLKRKWSLIKNLIGSFSKSQNAIKLMHFLMYGNWETFTDTRFDKFHMDIKEGFVGNTVLLSRRCIDKIGLWDERIQGADFDLYLRLKQRSIEKGDIKPLHYALGVFNHHFIRFTLNSGNYPPYFDRNKLISIEEKWQGKEQILLQDQQWP